MRIFMLVAALALVGCGSANREHDQAKPGPDAPEPVAAKPAQPSKLAPADPAAPEQPAFGKDFASFILSPGDALAKANLPDPAQHFDPPKSDPSKSKKPDPGNVLKPGLPDPGGAVKPGQQPDP